MRFTQTVPAIAASLALAACATAGPSGHSAAATRSPAEAHAACEALIYRAPAPGDAAALDCAHRLDLWR